MSWLKRVKAWMRQPVKPEVALEPEPEPEMAACGHYTLPGGVISAYGETIDGMLVRNEEGHFDHCLDCIAAMSIRCAWCRKAIFIGSPVTLYSPMPGFSVPDDAVVHSEDLLQLVGCLGCADGLAFRAGFWASQAGTSHGHVHRIVSPLELILSGERNVVVVKDVHDPNEQPSVFTG